MADLLPILKAIFNVVVIFMAVVAMMGMGLGLKVREVLEPLPTFLAWLLPSSPTSSWCRCCAG